MDRRPQLDNLLRSCFNGKPYVYYQPPASVSMNYPCIVYKLTSMPAKYADNIKYYNGRIYQLTVIDRDPDSILRENVAKLPRCEMVRSFVSDNLNHYVFDIAF